MNPLSLFFRACHEEQQPGNSLTHPITFRCTECTTRLPSWAKMACHLWRKHRIDMELYKCQECNFRSFTKKRLALHKPTHSTHKPYLCDDCGKAFKNEKNLKVHKRMHEPSTRTDTIKKDKGLICITCSRSFKSQKLLRHHVNSVHGRAKPHLCNFCGYSGQYYECISKQSIM